MNGVASIIFRRLKYVITPETDIMLYVDYISQTDVIMVWSSPPPFLSVSQKKT